MLTSLWNVHNWQHCLILCLNKPFPATLMGRLLLDFHFICLLFKREVVFVRLYLSVCFQFEFSTTPSLEYVKMTLYFVDRETLHVAIFWKRIIRAFSSWISSLLGKDVRRSVRRGEWSNKFDKHFARQGYLMIRST